jgi:hypothetical protein
MNHGMASTSVPTRKMAEHGGPINLTWPKFNRVDLDALPVPG